MHLVTHELTDSTAHTYSHSHTRLFALYLIFGCREIEERRAKKVASRLKELEEHQRGAAGATLTAQSTANLLSSLPQTRKDKEKVVRNSSSGKREGAGDDEVDTKRRRKQQQDDGGIYNAPSSSSITRSDEYGNYSCGSSGVKASSKLVIKNVKPAAAAKITSGFTGGNNEDGDDNKPLRTIVPLDYTGEWNKHIYAWI